MQRYLKIVLFPFLLFPILTFAQLKFIVEDFEGLCNNVTDLHKNGIFDYGSFKASSDETISASVPFYIQDHYLKIKKNGSQNFGGWGKGLNQFIELDVNKDLLNFYFLSDKPASFKICLQEDDNGTGEFEKEHDDNWIYHMNISGEVPDWKLISVPLIKFTDENKGGDGIFNCNYKSGKFLTIIISYEKGVPEGYSASFDMICFSEGVMNSGPVTAAEGCALGLWSEEGNLADFKGIARTYQKLFDSKPKIVHFFQPFSSDGGQTHNINASIEELKKLIIDGYTPMITIEDHYVDPDGLNQNTVQPNLYSIIEGHFDFFFTEWAKQIKELNGPVLVRILHEFNGDWYPWCIVKNEKDPKLFVKAFRHIRNIFTKLEVTNAKFIWCPNSMSLPQASWNFIMDAYPGDEYVDIIGSDIYNGSGENSGNWRSFRKEAIENYFLATKYFPDKPFIVCETASRERKTGECGQTKSEWILQMSHAIKTDLSEIRILNWFNEKESFKFNSSSSARESFLKNIVQDRYFSGDAEINK